MKKQNKTHQNAKSIGEKLKSKGLTFFVSFFHVICKISNFDMWTAKYLAQASCTELTLKGSCDFVESIHLPICILNVMFRPIYRLMSGRKARGLGSGKTTGSASHAARQRNLKQKFVSLLKKFKVTDPEELDQEQATLDQKISGKKN